jgi:hypothetical protein
MARETLKVLNLKVINPYVRTSCHMAHIKSIIQLLPYFVQQAFLYGSYRCDDPEDHVTYRCPSLTTKDGARGKTCECASLLFNYHVKTSVV